MKLEQKGTVDDTKTKPRIWRVKIGAIENRWGEGKFVY